MLRQLPPSRSLESASGTSLDYYKTRSGEVWEHPSFPQGPNPVREKSLLDYIRVILRRKWLFLTVVLVVCAIGKFIYSTRKPMYSAEAQLLVTSAPEGGESEVGSSDPVARVDSLTRSASVESQIAVISSPQLVQDAYNTLPLVERQAGFGGDGSEPPPGNVHVDADKETEVITVSAKSYDPKAAADFANAVSETYLTQDRERSSSTARDAAQFVDQQLQLTESKYQAATAALSKFQTQSGLVDADNQVRAASQRESDLQSAIQQARSSRAIAAKSAEAIADLIKQQSQVVPSGGTVAQNPSYAQTLQDLTVNRNALLAALQEYAPDSQRVMTLKSQIEAEETELSKISPTSVASTSTVRNGTLDKMLQDYEAQSVQAKGLSDAIVSDTKALDAEVGSLKQFPHNERELQLLQQSVDVLARTYNTLSDKYYQLVIAEKTILPSGYITSAATAPNRPSSPNRTQYAAIFGISSLVFGVLAVFIAEGRDSHIRDPHLSESQYGLLTLTAVPKMKALQKGGAVAIGNVARNEALLEAFRFLRNNILLSSRRSIEEALSAEGEDSNLLAITSPGAGEGKSTISLNLAISFGMDGKRVLLIDADLRRPSLHFTLHVPGVTGLCEVIAGNHSYDQVVVKSVKKNVDFLPAGTASESPTELLNSPASRDLFRELSKLYDYVIVDCPPTVGLSDVQVIGTIVDGMIIVVGMDKTTEQGLQACIRILLQVGVNVIGAAVNNVSKKDEVHLPYYFIPYGKRNVKALEPNNSG